MTNNSAVIETIHDIDTFRRNVWTSQCPSPGHAKQRVARKWGAVRVERGEDRYGRPAVTYRFDADGTSDPADNVIVATYFPAVGELVIVDTLGC